MISFFYETDFELKEEADWKNWIQSSAKDLGYLPGSLNYIFCDDNYLLEINKNYLEHDYYTDVIGFQYSKGKRLEGDIFISTDRVKENAQKQNISFSKELARVMIHGTLHFMGFDDNTEEETLKMREAENKYLFDFKGLE